MSLRLFAAATKWLVGRQPVGKQARSSDHAMCDLLHIAVGRILPG